MINLVANHEDNLAQALKDSDKLRPFLNGVRRASILQLEQTGHAFPDTTSVASDLVESNKE